MTARREPTALGRDLELLCDAARAAAAVRPSPRATDWPALRRRVVRRRRGRLLGGAAALAAAATLVWTFVPRLRGPEATDAPPAPAVGTPSTPLPPQAVQGGAYRILRPSDRVYLVADADGRIDRWSAGRLVLEAGTVWVRVDASRGPVPFSVATPRAEVRALGTRFMVRCDAGGSTDAAVLDGRVEVRRGAETYLLGEGMQLLASDREPMPLAVGLRAEIDTLLPRVEGERGVAAAPVPVDAGPAVSAPEPLAEVAPIGDGTVAEACSAPVERPGTEVGGGPSSGGGRGLGGEDAYAAAERAMAAGRWAVALAALWRVVESEPPGSAAAANALVEIRRLADRTGRTAAAVRACERYLAEHPAGARRAEMRIGLCRLRAAGGEVTAARSCFEAYLGEFPDGRHVEEARTFAGAAGDG